MSFIDFLKTFCCWILLIIFPGCGNNPVESNETKDVIMPLMVSNSWTYRVDLGYGTPVTLTWEISRQISLTYQGDTLLAFARTFRWNDDPRAPYEWLFWNGPDGLYLLGGISEDDTLVIKNLQYKYPAEVGDSWSVPDVRYDGSFYIVDTLLYSLIAKDEEFQTPAGNFKCYVYNYIIKPANDVFLLESRYLYFSPGIGQVGMIIRDYHPTQGEGDIEEKRVLLSYNVK